MQRAGNRPITISIKADNTVSEHHPLLLLAFSRSTRWHALRFSMEYHTLTRISPMLKGNMTFLRRLLLEVNNKTRPLHDDVIVNAFLDAPELQDVSLDGNIEFLVPLIPIPWSQITHYRDLWDITWRSWPDNAEILRETPNLTHLFGSYWWLDRHPPITMPHLHTLSLYGARIDPENESSDTFLDQLHAPRVRNLCVGGGLTTLTIEAYRRFMDRSASTLRAVSVDTQAWPKASRESLVLDLLKSIPDRVESLTLRDRMTEHWIIEALTLKLDGCNEDGRPRILPRLQDLRLYVFPDPHCDVLVNQLISMVESRIPSESGPGLLKKLRLDLRGRTRRILGAPYFKEKVLQSNGLEVDLSPPAWDRYFPIF
ncbi:hypothetical protein VNI00_004745 [Paramarasmius palmivorus]|uniref:F-box domain-containing protein n=1 Tax=Paramarasmius palmivorus TaxID=297713 RepID=A0AAW0DIL5_9AGAR